MFGRWKPFCPWLWLGVWGLVVGFEAGVPSSTMAQGTRLADQLIRENPDQLADDVMRWGDPVRGALAFFRPEMNCSKCHEPGGSGRRLGPDLAERRAVSVSQLAMSVLHPSDRITDGYETTLLLLADGRQLSGIVVSENDRQLKLDRIEEPDQPLVIPIDDIEERRRSNQSTMPEGLVNQLGSRSEFLDLIRYLREIASEGAVRAAQLRPTTSPAALMPLPDYESQVDHRGLIESWNPAMFRQGEEIFRLRCASCHGDLEQEGSMPTSLRFAEGKFKHGADPYSIYQTLTHGYGMMIPQRWMVPQQKYAVIHYLREAYLRDRNPSQYVPMDEAYLAGLPQGTTRGPDPIESKPWTAMDYGSSLLNTIEVSRDGSNIAQKGIAIRLDDGPGGVAAGKQWILYDHDTMRVAGSWQGQFIDYNGIHFNGVHNQHPHIAGSVLFENPEGPGWGHPLEGIFSDPRPRGRDDRPYGPLPRDWVQYRGLYRYGTRTVLRYTVGDTEVLETPSLQFAGSTPTVVRTLNLGPRRQDLWLQVTQASNPFVADGHAMISWNADDSDAGGTDSLFDGKTYVEVANGDDWDTYQGDFSIALRVQTRSDGTLISKTRNQERWLANGQTLFLRAGRPTFDIGWVGAVSSSRRVDDGKWHEVVMNWNADNAQVNFWVDGEPAGGGTLRAQNPLKDSVVRIGFTNENFPENSYFRGQIADVQLIKHQLAMEPAAAEKAVDQKELFAHWPVMDREHLESDATRGPMTMRVVSSSVGETRSAGLMLTAETEQGPVSSQWWQADGDGNLRLRIPAGEQPLRLNVNVTVLQQAQDQDRVVAAMREFQTVPSDLKPLTVGGPASWPDVLETTIQTGVDAPFAVDFLNHPVQNPGNCRMRMTGIDFEKASDSAVISTWDGSVWRVRGLGQVATGSRLQWRRIAAGLFQPLGIKIREGTIFVTCRDQLVALHDLNGDEEIDWYECFNNDHQVTEHFHEFAMGLQTDAAGNFYYAKSARHALPALVPHHGTLLKISADGQRTEIIANGFRAANGVCINPDGSFVVTDQEGHWNPKNRINWVTGGGFYGNMLGYHDVTDSSDAAMEPPLCWITNSFDRSPAELLWVDSERWGALRGALLNFSYGYGKMYVVPHESVNGRMQGGMCAFEIPQFPTGVMRGRFHPVDGQLYCCGMFAWSGTQEQPGGLYRVRYTGGPIRLPIGLHALEGAIEIEFTDPLLAEAACDPQNFAVQAWDLKRTRNYGSEHFNVHSLPVAQSRLLEDGKTVRLEMPDLAPTWCMEIVYALKSADGQAFQGRIHNTIHELGRASDATSSR